MTGSLIGLNQEGWIPGQRCHRVTAEERKQRTVFSSWEDDELHRGTFGEDWETPDK